MKNILLIEDNLEVRENTAEILELAGYNVLTAPNGKSGVELAQKELPDLVICDIMMPELDGYGVLHILNKNPNTSGIPFIFLTAKAERSDFRKGMNLGADDYLTKPFDESELLDAVETRLKKNNLFKKDYQPDINGLNEFIEEAKDLEDLIELSEDRKVRLYKKKNNIYWEMDYANSLFFINSGKVKTYKTNKDGKQLITSIYGKGDFIGFKALMAGTKYTDSAMAMEDSEVCKIPKEDFFKLLYSSKDVANKFIRILSNNIREKEEQLLHLAYNSVRQRVAEKLLALKDKYDPTSPSDGFAISREDLASMVGTATESVIRTLSDFKDERMIEIKSGNIRITDEERLQLLVKRGY